MIKVELDRIKTPRNYSFMLFYSWVKKNAMKLTGAVFIIHLTKVLLMNLIRQDKQKLNVFRCAIDE